MVWEPIIIIVLYFYIFMKNFFKFSLLIVLALSAFVSCKKGTIPFLDVPGPDTIGIPVEGGRVDLPFYCNRDWQVSSSESWCTVTPASGTGDASLSFDRKGDGYCVSIICGPNAAAEPRRCKVVIFAGGWIKEVVVKQQGTEQLIVSPEAFSLSGEAQSFKLLVKADVQYTVGVTITVEPGVGDWLLFGENTDLTKEEDAFCTTEHVFGVTENTGGSERIGRIHVTQFNSVSGENLVREVTVRQAPKQ